MQGAQQTPSLLQDPPPKLIEPVEQTVEEAINDALASLRYSHNSSLSDEQRKAARDRYELRHSMIGLWLGDRKLAGVGRKSLEALELADNILTRENARKAMDPAAYEARIRELFPRSSSWHEEALRVQNLPPSEITGAHSAPDPDGETLAEMFRAGDPVASKYSGVPDLSLSGGTARKSFLRWAGDKVGLTDPAIELDDEVAVMPAGWNDPELMRKRVNAAHILYDELEVREDGSKFVRIVGKDGAEREVSIPNFSNLRDFYYQSQDGVEHKVHVTDELARELVKSREGGAYSGTIAGGVQKLFTGTRETMYGEQLVPSITGNPLVDGEMLEDPVIQRAIMDVPRPKMFWWDVWRSAYGLGEFAATLAVTRGIGGAVARTAASAGRAVATAAEAQQFARATPLWARAVGEVAKPHPGAEFLGRFAGAYGQGFLGGARVQAAATRFAGVFYDTRLIPETMWYHAVSGLANGHWEPGEWVKEGITQGTELYAWGAAARGSRAVMNGLLETGLMRKTPFAKWSRALTLEDSTRLERARLSMSALGDKATLRALEHAAKEGILDAQRIPVARELIASVYDTFIVGTGIGAWARAHQIAEAEHRKSITLEDFGAALGDRETWASALGMVLAHTAGVGAMAMRNANNPDAVPLVKGWLGVELGPKQRKFINDLAQSAAERAHFALSNPEHAAAIDAAIEALGETNLSAHMALQELKKRYLPEAVVPEPKSGSGMEALVKDFTADRKAFDDALRYESQAGLERIYTALSNGNPGEYPGEWNAPIRDMKNLVIEHIERFERGEPRGQELTGQRMADRERRALQNWNKSMRDDAANRRDYTSALKRTRRALLRTIRLKGKLDAENARLQQVYDLKLRRGAEREKDTGRKIAFLNEQIRLAKIRADQGNVELENTVMKELRRRLRQQISQDRKKETALRDAVRREKRKAEAAAKSDELAVKSEERRSERIRKNIELEMSLPDPQEGETFLEAARATAPEPEYEGPTIKEVAEKFDVPVRHASAVMKIARAMGLDLSKIVVEKGGKPGPDALYQKNGVSMLYSNIGKALEQWQPSGTVDQLIALINKTRGGKEEAETIGLLDFLYRDQRIKGFHGKITRAEVLEYVNAHQPVLEEVVRKEEDAISIFEMNELDALEDRMRRYSDTMSPQNVARMHELRAKFKAAPRYMWSTLTEPGGTNYRELLVRMPVLKPEFKHAHWPEGNIIYHIRMDDRVTGDGRKVLFMEELQSDLHQNARAARKVRVKTLLYNDANLTLEEAEKLVPKDYGYTKSEAAALRGRSPDAPFKVHGWKKLALKRMLLEVALEGYDGLAWTTGDQQNARSMKDKLVKKVEWDRQNALLIVVDSESERPDIEFEVHENMLPLYLGKKIADRLLQSRSLGSGVHYELKFEGDGYPIDAEAFKTAYDKELPNLAEDVAKDYGLKAGKVEMPYGAKAYSYDLPVGERQIEVNERAEERSISGNFLPVPKEVRDQIAEHGLPMFQGGKASVEFMQDGHALIRALENPDVSSALHEIAHIGRRWKLNVESGFTKEQVRHAEEWSGAKDGVWSVEAEEKFARGFERYLIDGVSPTQILGKVFKSLARWLGKIYATIAGSDIDVDITPQMRAVYDRLVSLGEGYEAVPSAGEIARTHESIAAALEGTPEYAHLEGDVTAIVDRATEGLDPGNFAALKAVEAEVTARAAARARDAGIGHSLQMPSAEGVMPAESEEAAALAEKRSKLRFFIKTGEEVLRPRIAPGRGPNESIKAATAAGIQSAIAARFGLTPQIREEGRAGQEGLALGLLMSASLRETIDPLVRAVTGLDQADVNAIRSRLRRRFDAVDQRISDAFVEWEQLLGKPVLSERQRRHPDTVIALRVLSLFPDMEFQLAASTVFSGRNRGKIVDEVLENAAVAARAHIEAVPHTSPAGMHLADAADAMVVHQAEALREAMKEMPRSGIQVENLWLTLKKKIAYAHTRRQSADDVISGTNYTVRDVTDGLIKSMSGEQVRRPEGKTTGGSVAVVPTQASETGEEVFTKSVEADSAAEAERKGTEKGFDPLAMASRLASVAVSHRKLLRDIAVKDLVDADGKPLVHEATAHSEVARTELKVIDGLIHQTQGTIDLLIANEWSPEQIRGAGKRALALRGELQKILEQYAALGLPVSENRGALAEAELRHLFKAFELRAQGQRVDGEARKILEAGGWLDKEGELRESAAGELFDLARSAILDALDSAGAMAAAGEGGFEAVVRASTEIDQAPRIELMWAGGKSSKDLLHWAHIAADCVMGFYDRRTNFPYRAEYETLSVPGVTRVFRGGRPIQISMSAMLDHFNKKKGLGKIGEHFGQYALRAWQRTFSGKARGVGTADIKLSNRKALAADARGRAIQQRVLTIYNQALDRVFSIGMDSRELEFLGKLVSAGARKDINSQAEWTKLFGPQLSRLYPVFLEVNDAFSRMADMLVDEGVMDLDRAKQLNNSYLPKKTMQFLYGAKGIPILRGTEENQFGRFQMGSFEYMREKEDHRETVRQIFDISYVLPTSAAQVSQRLRVVHTMQSIVDMGVHWTREQYDAAPGWTKAQLRRAASRGKAGRDAITGLPIPGFDEKEWSEKYAPIEDPLGEALPELLQAENERRAAEAERELAERADADIYQTMLQAWIDKERDMHTGADAPVMTEKMKKLLDTLETAYVPINVAKDIALMLDQTELSPSVNDSSLADISSRIVQEWRRNRTVYSPRHVRQQMFGSNWLSSAMTGKVPLHDFLNPHGAMQTSLARLGKLQSMLSAGQDPMTSEDPGVRHAQRYMDRSGASSHAEMFHAPVSGKDLLAGFVGDIQRRYRASGMTMTDTLASEFAVAAAGAQRAMTDATKWIDTLSNAVSPDLRAEALRAEAGMYGYVDHIYKYAAQLEGERMGKSEDDAYHWGGEGVGDLRDANPSVHAFSSLFSLMRGNLYTKGRTMLGKGAKIGTAGPKATRAQQVFALAEHVRMTGIGGPFWSWSATLVPAIGRGLVNHPFKVFTGLGVFTFMVRASSTVFGDDDDDFYATQAGRGPFLHANFDAETFDAYARAYGHAPAYSGIGPWTLTVREWVKYGKAYLLNPFREHPEASMLTRFEGPQLGGTGTEVDMAGDIPGASAMAFFSDMIHSWGQEQPFTGRRRGSTDYGWGFLPSSIAAIWAAGIEMAQGVQGKSRMRVAGEHMAEFLQEFSSPGGGLPWIFSRDGQKVIGPIAWDNRTVGEMIEGLPASEYPDEPIPALAKGVMHALMPMRRRPSQSAIPQPEDREVVPKLLGTRLRDAPQGEEIDVEAARRGSLAREGILNSLSWAYRGAQHYGAPLGLWNAQAVDLGRDLKPVEVGDERKVVMHDIVDNPQTVLGKFIRNAEATPRGRQLLTAAVIKSLRQNMPELKALADDDQGLVYRTALPAELYDRMAAGVLDRSVNASAIVRLLWREMADPKRRAETKGAYDGIWARTWMSLGLDNEISKSEYQSGAKAEMVLDINRFLDNTRIALPDKNQSEELKGALGPRAWDIFPLVMNHRPYSLLNTGAK